MKSLLIAVSFLTSLLFPLAWGESGNSQRGETVFSTHGCSGCHSVTGENGSSNAGPDLKGVTKIRQRAWLKKWLQDPVKMRHDPIIQSFRQKYPVPMPETGLTESQINDVIAYLDKISK